METQNRWIWAVVKKIIKSSEWSCNCNGKWRHQKDSCSKWLLTLCRIQMDSGHSLISGTMNQHRKESGDQKFSTTSKQNLLNNSWNVCYTPGTILVNDNLAMNKRNQDLCCWEAYIPILDTEFINHS